MRYGIGTLRENQQKRLSLIWIKFAWNKSVGIKALVVCDRPATFERMLINLKHF